MRAKSLALLMLALGCGLVASIGITQVMAKRNAEPAPSGEMQEIFVALKDIPLGERLSAEYLKLEPWPKDKVPLGSATKMEDIEGCRAKTRLYAGEPILEKKLFAKGSNMGSDSALIPKGYRVVPVKVDNQSGGPGLIMPGDRVDVLVHLVRTGNSSDIQETTTRTILQDIKVFAINDVVHVDDKDKDVKEKDKINAKTISLLVTPAQGAKLMLASEMGKVQLFMRSPEDDSTSHDGVSTPSDLFGDSKKAARSDEKLYKPEPEVVAEKKSTALADILKNMKKIASKAKVSVASVPNATWTMRILQPNGINELVMEADAGPQAAKMPQGGWHLISTNVTSIGGSSVGGNNKAQSPPPTVPAPTVPAPTVPAPTVPAPTAPAANPPGPVVEPGTNPNPQETTPPAEATADPLSSSSVETNPIRGD